MKKLQQCCAQPLVCHIWNVGSFMKVNIFRSCQGQWPFDLDHEPEPEINKQLQLGDKVFHRINFFCHSLCMLAGPFDSGSPQCRYGVLWLFPHLPLQRESPSVVMGRNHILHRTALLALVPEVMSASLDSAAQLVRLVFSCSVYSLSLLFIVI